MRSGSPALRAAIDAPDGFDRMNHREMIEQVAGTIPHSIVFCSLEDEGTCVAYAFGLTANSVYRFVAAGFRRKIFAGRGFVEWLLQNHLREIKSPERNSLALYFSNGRWEHIGVVTADGRVVSQWGTFPVYEHAVFEVPARYGNEVRYFQRPSNAEILRLFLEYTKTWGLSDADVEWITQQAGDP
jgi:hypothetical protein